MIKTNKVLSIFSSIITVAASVFFIYELVTLHLIPTKLLIPIVIIFILINAIILVLLNFYGKNIVTKLFMIMIVLVIACLSSFGGLYLMKTSNMFNQITKYNETVKQTVSVVVKENSAYEDLKDIKNQDLAVLENSGSQGISKCIKDLDDKHIKVNVKKYEGISAMVDALEAESVAALIITESSRGNILDIEEYKNFNKVTRTIYQAEYLVKDTNKSKAVKNITTEPFNILVTGSDSRVSLYENSRSDVNMLITVNPKTSTILLTSIPRDYYVETVCDIDDACLIGQLDKLTHTGVHGVNTTKKTVENLLGIEINYTLKVGFESVTGIVDALGGINVNVAPGYAVSSFHTAPQYGVVEGVNHLNGEQALAYARERYAYQEGDRQRVKNQQEVLMAVIDKVTSPSVISGYSNLMDALGNTFITNMKTKEIQELIQYQLKVMPSWKFEQNSLDGTGSTEYCAELGQAAYVMIPDRNTIESAKIQINEVVNKKQ